MNLKDKTKNTTDPEPTQGTLPIKVSNEVVGHLSVGLYRNFARAVKELVSNSYDAGATEVKIKLDLNNQQVIVRDNGLGMNLVEIKDKFLFIARRTYPNENTDEFGRKKIGSFGIGFLSTFPYCKKLVLITKKQGEINSIHVEIDTDTFFRGDAFQITEIEVPYSIEKSDLPKDKGETIIILQKIAPHILTDLKEESHGLASIDKIGGFQKFKWTIAQYAPIEFPVDQKELQLFFDIPFRRPMKLWLNATELFRNVPKNAIILDKGDKKFGDVEVKFVIMTPKEPVRPSEARGLQVRLRDVAIGFPTDFDITKVTGKVPGKLNYLCGEVHILRGLDSALMVDRDHFSYTEDIAKMEEFFREQLNKWSDKLEDWSKRDRELLEIVNELDHSDHIIKDLYDTNVLHFSKERLRLPKEAPFVKQNKIKSPSIANRLKNAFEKGSDYKVIIEKNKQIDSYSPITVQEDKNTITINETHPSFSEEITLLNQKYGVSYDQWKLENNDNDICKIIDGEQKVIFNANHPLFKSKISEDVVKKLSLGFLLIIQEQKEKKDSILRLNKLLEEVFLRS